MIPWLRKRTEVSEQPPASSGMATLVSGTRTRVREFQRADVDRWIAWPPHRDLLFHGYNPPLLSLRERDRYYHERAVAPTARQYAVDDLQGQLIGRISLRELDWEAGISVLGITFHAGRLGQGYGTDALHAFLEYYFSTRTMQALFLDVAAFNQRAQRLYEKVGFRECGRRWGDLEADLAGVFRRPEHERIRQYFQMDRGLVRPLVIDMVLRREEWAART
ncbi:MAG: GNAT family N-acetyltransferase [Armatimonadetes bacterium]|nr:GNAT family N-acetyltransferase [Armatimonadota bacterium]